MCPDRTGTYHNAPYSDIEPERSLDALSANNPFYAATTLSEAAIGSGIETCEPGE